jgi:hypothetical protein
VVLTCLLKCLNIDISDHYQTILCISRFIILFVCMWDYLSNLVGIALKPLKNDIGIEEKQAYGVGCSVYF